MTDITRDDKISYISDTYKEINGFRPRCNWPELSDKELDQWAERLSKSAAELQSDERDEEKV